MCHHYNHFEIIWVRVFEKVENEQRFFDAGQKPSVPFKISKMSAWYSVQKKQIVGMFYDIDLSKTNQSEFRVEKEISINDKKLYVK